MELPTRYSKLSFAERREVREEYIRRQNHNCWYCNQPIRKPPPEEVTNKPINWKLFPKGFLNHPIHLQHNHDTDMTEGAVHAYCNAVLWQYHER